MRFLVRVVEDLGSKVQGFGFSYRSCRGQSCPPKEEVNHKAVEVVRKPEEVWHWWRQ